MAVTHRDGDLLTNSDGIGAVTRIVRSRAKEEAINASTQIPNGGIIVVVSYGDTYYVKITDGAKSVADLDPLGEGEDAGSVAWDDITGKPESFPTSSSEISDATPIGIELLTSTDADTALEALGGTEIGINILQAPIADVARTELELGALATLSTVGTDQIADASVTVAKIANTTITAAKIANTTITNAQIATAAAIGLTKLANVAAYPAGGITAATLQTVLNALADRITALEEPIS